MPRSYRQIAFEQRGEVWCVRLRSFRLEEQAVHQLAEELLDLATRHDNPKIALSLGPKAPQCLYSVFLAKLVMVQRHLHQREGGLVLCEVSPEVRSVFEACRLDQQFRFAKDFDEAIDLLTG
jgi:anti-anti-sigma factor